MSSYSTTVPKPINHQDFEERASVLFRELLNDPNLKRFGRSGQGQEGIDLLGKRNGSARKLVGVQCKLKGENEKVTEKELRAHVKMALAIKPKLSEYIFISTAPDDVKLDKLAATLAQQQRKKGRKTDIVIWGWETVQARINESHAAKKAFDPAFSPGFQEVQNQIDTILQAQRATGAQVGEIAAKFEQAVEQDQGQIPAPYADQLLGELFERALRRRGLAGINWQAEISNLADRAISGEFSLASNKLRADVAGRAARANATPDRKEVALRYAAFAQSVDAGRNDPVFEALMVAANGDTNKAVQLLRMIGSPDALAGAVILLTRAKGDEVALEWFTAEGFTIDKLNPPGALNYLMKLAQGGKAEKALADVLTLPSKYFEGCPALHVAKGHLTIATILPQDQKAALFYGFGLNPRALQLASGLASRAKIKEARQEFAQVLSQADELDLGEQHDVLEEMDLWLQLEDPDTASSARARLKVELSDPTKTLKRLRLALAYEIPFNEEALQRQLKARKEAGGWTGDDAFAALLLAHSGGDPAKLAAFFDDNRADLFSQEQLNRQALAGLEVEALTLAGRLEDAKDRLKLNREYLLPDQIDLLTQEIEAKEGGDELEQLKKQYDLSHGLNVLRVLVGVAAKKQDHKQLSQYAPILVREARQVADFRLAVVSLFNEREYRKVIQTCEEYPDLYSLDPEFKSLRAWAHFQIGDILNARTLARELFEGRGERNDRELAINTAVELGDIGYLQALVAKELANIEALDAATLIRLARLAHEVGSPYVDQFRDAGIRRFPDNPNVFLTGYTLALERGVEQHDEQAHLWFQRAAQLSGKDGPVQSLSFKEVVDQTKGWSEHVENIGQMLSGNEAPIFLAAKGLRRQPAEMLVGQALRNRAETNPAAQVPILAFAGKRPPGSMNAVRHVALDATAIVTLDYIGLLEKTLSLFERVVIAPTTLSNLFVQRQFLKFGQPSRAKKAQRILDLVLEKKLQVLPGRPPAPFALRKEVGEDLADLLSAAEQDRAVVVRSAPVHKIGSLLEEDADVSAYHGVLADTLSVLGYLGSAGKVDAVIKESAEIYLKQVDKGFPNGRQISRGDRLYLDSLTITYLDHVGLLKPLAESTPVFIPTSVEEDARSILRQSEFSTEIVGTIDRIRTALGSAIESGRVVFASHRSKENASDDQDEEDISEFPTLELLSDFSLFDVVVTDDRFLNKEQTWSHASGKVVQTATTLDLLKTLHSTGKIGEADYRAIMHKLREAGYCCVPVGRDELLHYLTAAPLHDGEVVETPELRALRENVSLPKRAGIYGLNDESWLTLVRYAFVQALRELWSRNPSVEGLEGRADWLLQVLPKPMVWCPNAADPKLWALAVQQTIGQCGLCAIFLAGSQEERARYGRWIDERLFAPLNASHPWLMQRVIEFVMGHIEQLIQVDHEAA